MNSTCSVERKTVNSDISPLAWEQATLYKSSIRYTNSELLQPEVDYA